MYELPAEFNAEILKRCEYGLARWLNICPRVANGGYGQPYNSSLGDGWFHTDSYMLEIIFHQRMKQYRCLTLDPVLADAVFVPYYSGLDALRYLYFAGPNRAREPSHGADLMSWLRERDEWKRRGGRDHLMVMGRTAWDFVVRRGWGTGMLELPGVHNMTLLMIERRSWQANEMAVPYPTSFHPSSSQKLQEWMTRVRESTRTRLFAFAGSIRPYADDGGFRGLLMRLCARSPGSCRLLDCRAARCSQEAEPVMRAFMESIFCLQPPGDTPTRRSTFDAIIAGCIPVFFNRDSAYTQYTWHLPTGGDESDFGYSVYIPQDDVVYDESVVERVLWGFSSKRVKEMQDKVASLIPRVIYMARSTSGDSEAAESVEDAFDVSVERVLHKVSEQKQAAKYEEEKKAAVLFNDIDIDYGSIQRET